MTPQQPAKGSGPEVPVLPPGPMEVIAVSEVQTWPEWRSEVDCEECVDWEGPPPVPLWEARRRFPAELGFEVGHAHYLTRDMDGEPLSIPTTVVRHPGMDAQFFPEAAPAKSGGGHRSEHQAGPDGRPVRGDRARRRDASSPGRA